MYSSHIHRFIGAVTPSVSAAVAFVDFVTSASTKAPLAVAKATHVAHRDERELAMYTHDPGDGDPTRGLTIASTTRHQGCEC